MPWEEASATGAGCSRAQQHRKTHANPSLAECLWAQGGITPPQVCCELRMALYRAGRAVCFKRWGEGGQMEQGRGSLGLGSAAIAHTPSYPQYPGLIHQYGAMQILPNPMQSSSNGLCAGPSCPIAGAGTYPRERALKFPPATHPHVMQRKLCCCYCICMGELALDCAINLGKLVTLLGPHAALPSLCKQYPRLVRVLCDFLVFVTKPQTAAFSGVLIISFCMPDWCFQVVIQIQTAVMSALPWYSGNVSLLLCFGPQSLKK